MLQFFACFLGKELPEDLLFLKVDENSGKVFVSKDVDRESFNESNYFEVSISFLLKLLFVCCFST